MTRQEFAELLAEYEEQAQLEVTERHKAAMQEIARAEWVGQEIERLITAGETKTGADKAAHAAPEHREYQRKVAALTHAADQADRRSRALYLALRWAIVSEDRERVRLEEVDHVG